MAGEPIDIEQQIKLQFAKQFEQSDWVLFQDMAEFYLAGAAALRKADIDAPPSLSLLARNSQKRLHIGIGIELLLKAVLLKRGYHINKLKPKQHGAPPFPFTFQQAVGFQLELGNTYTLGEIIAKFPKEPPVQDMDALMRGLKIAKVFRNKEGHAVYSSHVFDASNYRDIEASLRILYANDFRKELRVAFSMEPNEASEWRVLG
jgi:hypothetical protein